MNDRMRNGRRRRKGSIKRNTKQRNRTNQKKRKAKEGGEQPDHQQELLMRNGKDRIAFFLICFSSFHSAAGDLRPDASLRATLTFYGTQE